MIRRGQTDVRGDAVNALATLSGCAKIQSLN